MIGKVTHHAVEEEARLMRIIMQKAKNESFKSIQIMQEHNWVMDFFKNKIEAIENRINSEIDQKGRSWISSSFLCLIIDCCKQMQYFAIYSGFFADYA